MCVNSMAQRKNTILPLEVSPLIKLARWTFLIGGIVHGFNKRRKYIALDTALRERDAEKRAMQEEYFAREKLLRDAAELRDLERIFLGTSSSDERTNEKTGICDDTEFPNTSDEQFDERNFIS